MKVILTIINLIIATLFFSMIYSAANVNVEVGIGESRGMAFNMRNNNLVAAVPVDINNRGLYPITNISIRFNIANNSSIIYKHSFHINEIEALHNYQKTFIMTVNLTSLYEKLGSYYVFHSGTFRINVFVCANYWMMAKFEATFSKKVDWQSLLYTYQIYKNDIYINNNTVYIPYFVSKMPLKINATMHTEISDFKGILAVGYNKIFFDRKAVMQIHMVRNCNYLITSPDVWTIKTTLQINALSVNRVFSYTWTPPIGKVSFNEKLNNNSVVLYFGFENNYKKSLNIEVHELISEKNKTQQTWQNITVKTGKYVLVPLVKLTPEITEVSLIIWVKNLDMQKSFIYNQEVSS